MELIRTNWTVTCFQHSGGKMRLIKTLPALLFCLLLWACNLGAAPPPEGSFLCMGYENGLGAQAGVLTLDPNGTLDFNGYEGTWTYDADTHELVFEGNRYLATGIYHPEQDFLVLYLKPDAELSHGDGGMISCARSDELIQPGD